MTYDPQSQQLRSRKVRTHKKYSILIAVTIDSILNHLIGINHHQRRAALSAIKKDVGHLSTPKRNMIN
jgi:hypothetical protein